MGDCKYCTGKNEDRLMIENDYVELYLTENGELNIDAECADAYSNFTSESKINYCPMCGRKL